MSLPKKKLCIKKYCNIIWNNLCKCTDNLQGKT